VSTTSHLNHRWQWGLSGFWYTIRQGPGKGGRLGLCGVRLALWRVCSSRPFVPRLVRLAWRSGLISRQTTLHRLACSASAGVTSPTRLGPTPCDRIERRRSYTQRAKKMTGHETRSSGILSAPKGAAEGVEGRVAAFTSCPSQLRRIYPSGALLGNTAARMFAMRICMAIRTATTQNFHCRALATRKSRNTCTFLAVFSSSG
jgi:hypothetical protein